MQPDLVAQPKHTLALDRQHADGLWPRYDSYRARRHQGTAYALPVDNPFQDWKAGQRYAAETEFDEARVRAHRTGATMLRAIVKQANLDGIL